MEIAISNLDVQGIMLHVAQIIIDELKLEDVSAETFEVDLDLVNELGIDSMDLTTVVLVCEDEFSITIDEDDYPRLKTLRLIAQYIQGRMCV